MPIDELKQEMPAEEIPTEEIAEEIAEVKDEVQAAQEELANGDIPAAEARLIALEDRLAAMESGYQDLRQSVESKADSSHDHPLPPGISSVAEALEEIENEEREPVRTHPIYRKLRGN